MAMRSLLVFSRDPGPTNLLVATLKVLTGQTLGDVPPGLALLRSATAPLIGNLRIVSRPPGEVIWRDGGFAPATWDGRNEDAALRLLQENDAGVLLTGTSDLDEPGDRLLWPAARRLGIESHAVLDHPAALEVRFQAADGAMIWPDWLYVSDNVFYERLAAFGAPKDRIRLIGDLHHARLRKLATSRNRDEVLRLRAAWGADEEKFVLLFASECVWEMSLLGFKSTYREVDVFDAMLAQLSRGQRPDGGHLDKSKIVVVLRPHPRDTEGKYDEIIAKWREAVRVVISVEGSADLAILAADLTVGMNSSLLYEAALLGRPAISLTGHDILASKSTAI